MPAAKKAKASGGKKTAAGTKPKTSVKGTAAKKQSKPAADKNTKPKTKPKETKPNSKAQGIHREVTIFAMAGAAVLLFVFLISGSSNGAGVIGRLVSYTLHGLMGIGSWILPISLLIGAMYLVTEKSDDIFRTRVILSVILFIDMLAFIHSFGGIEIYEGKQLHEIISSAFRDGANNNGGLIGALVYVGCYKLVGNVGCYIVFIMLALILVMLISGGSLIGGMRRMAGYVDGMRSEYDDYYDYDDDYYDDDYDDYEEESYPQPVKAPMPARRTTVRPQKPYIPNIENDKPVVFDMGAGGDKKKKSDGKKIDLITGDTLIGEPEPEEQDLTGHIQLFDIKRRMSITEQTEEKTEDKKLPVYDAELDKTEDEPKPDTYFDNLTDISALTENIEEPVSKFETGSEKADEQPKAVHAEDTPPWEESYSPAEEPEIREAEKTKLVDSLEVEKPRDEYKFPKLEFLGVNKNNSEEKTKAEILRKAKKLEDSLAIFNVEAKVDNISIGPTVTRYELTPSKGTKVSAVTKLENDIMFSMAAESIIIEAPIPGKSAIGIEIPNDTRESVYFSEVLRSEQFQKFKSKIAFGLGKDITGSVTVADLAKMPHLLVAGTTGSGKSVCINTLIMSILYKATPDEVKMIMVDPKMVELSVYNGIPHLLLPVVTEPEKAAGALNWAVIEMERRYKLLATTGTRNIEGYNQKVGDKDRLTQIVIIIDELADLMMVVGKEIETSICRLAQKARAAGMHLVLATQRPSADVLTGLIRSNVPSRIAFKVSGSMDSRIILDSTGAEKLLGKGDMLFKTADMAKPMRVQGAFVTDDEVEKVVEYIAVDDPQYDEKIINEISKASITVTSGADDGEDDPMTDEVLDWIVANPKGASAGKVQRHFRIGFNRASRIIETLEDRGILGPTNGSQPREVLMDKYELRERKERYDDYGDI